MGHMKIIVDHDKIEYSGPFNLKDLLRAIENYMWEHGYDKKQDKDTEIHTSQGKHIEWQYSPWKKITDYVRYFFKIRVIGHEISSVDAKGGNGKKVKVDNGRVIIVIDAFIEYDYDNYWDDKAFFYFLRMIYDYFIFKAYTDKFEQTLAHDSNRLHHHLEQFFNIYRHYHVISRHAQ